MTEEEIEKRAYQYAKEKVRATPLGIKIAKPFCRVGSLLAVAAPFFMWESAKGAALMFFMGVFSFYMIWGCDGMMEEFEREKRKEAERLRNGGKPRERS